MLAWIPSSLKGSAPSPSICSSITTKSSFWMPPPYWGKGAIDVEVEFKHKYGEEYQVAAIGPGGENQVLYACINHDFGRQAGRGGVGAVMGSKKVKAIVLHGTKSVTVADPENLPQSRHGTLQSL